MLARSATAARPRFDGAAGVLDLDAAAWLHQGGGLVTQQQYEQLVRDEYAWLCAKLGLAPVPVRFEHDDDLGTAPRYGGTPREIVIPVSSHDRSVISGAHVTQAGDPPEWDPHGRDGGYHYWAEWRTTIWHEVGHQVDDQVLKTWDPKDPHGASWTNSMTWMAGKLGAPSATILAGLIPSME